MSEISRARLGARQQPSSETAVGNVPATALWVWNLPAAVQILHVLVLPPAVGVHLQLGTLHVLWSELCTPNPMTLQPLEPDYVSAFEF